MPARASFLTGRSPEANGVLRNGYALNENALPLFSEILRRNGYRTVWNGKHHWKCQMDGVPGPGRYFGFDEHNLADDNQIGPYFDWLCSHGRKYRDMAVGNMYNLPPEDHPFWVGREYIGPAEIAMMRSRHIEPRMLHPDRNVCYWISPLPDDLTQTAWIADRAIETIQRGSDQPFFIAASFADPHDPYNPTEKFFREIDPKQCPPPKVRAGEHEMSPPHYRAYLDGAVKSPEFGWINRALRHSPEEWQMLRTCYFAKVNAIDYHIGRILSALDQAGLKDDTAVVFTSDHGDMLGDHGMITKGSFHYDSCIRTPLIVRPGQTGARGAVCETPTNLLDLFPTFLDLAGIDHSRVLLEGRSLKPLFCGSEASFERDFTISEIYRPHGDPSIYRSEWAKTLRNTKWRYTWFPGDRFGQLFDLENDPDEFDNLWGNPEFSATREGLRTRLFEMLATRSAPLPAPQYYV